MVSIIDNCLKYCDKWNGAYISTELTVWHGDLYILVIFQDGSTCWFKTDLHGIRELYPGAKEMIRWNEANAVRRIEMMSGHIVDVNFNAGGHHCDCPIYVELFCASANNEIFKPDNKEN